jgi:mRNA-degrading endonuclease RelE of RelBE toxin-antitoxin system
MHSTPIAALIDNFLRRTVMNAILKTLIAAGIVASFSMNAMAADAAPAKGTPPNAQPSAGAGTAPEQKHTTQEHMERMKTMSPEQRAKEHEAMRKEWDSLTPQQRDAKRKEMHEQLKKMSPEERRAMHEKMREHMMNMSPEERARQREQMRKEWDSLTPQQREARRKEMHERFEKMPPEERAERRKEMRERFEKMSPEERAQFKRDMDRHGGMSRGFSDPSGSKPDDAKNTADTKTPAGK